MNSRPSRTLPLSFAAAMAASALLRAQEPAAPVLRVQSGSGGTIELRWPRSFQGFSLQETAADAFPAGWSPVVAPGTEDGTDRVVPVAASGQKRLFRLISTDSPFTTVDETSPVDLEDGVSVNRETVLRLSAPLAADAVIHTEDLFAGFGGRRWLSRAELSDDRRTVTLFYLEPLPASATMQVVLVGDRLRDAQGRALDADGDGKAGGTRVFSFTTSGNTPVSGTAVIGHVFAAEPTPGGTNLPLSGVTITVDGAEESLRATTAADGSFRLQPAPTGRFFVHVDGRTAKGSQWPSGAYYPFVGKAWEATAGRTNNLAGGTGIIFLPLVPADALKAVSATNETVITFPPSVLQSNPGLAGVSLIVPPNALFSENGTRGGRIGLAPVPPDRIPEPLPPGLDIPLVITVQTDGPQNFDQPIPARFPNLPDPKTGLRLGPGEKTTLWSFNHDTGRWEAQGAATISADGNFAVTDPGVGIRQPGWHGVNPGIPAGGGPLGGPGPGPNPPCPSPGGGGGGDGQDCHPKPGWDPKEHYNGCGPDGKDYLVPDNPNVLFPCASFYEACKQHDIGYSTCGRPKSTTDEQFLQDMLAACDCVPFISVGDCKARAILYYEAVKHGGGGAYDAAQQDACDCTPPPPCPGAAASFAVRHASPAGPPNTDSIDGTRPTPGTIVPQLGPHRFAIVDLLTKQVVQRGHAGSSGIALNQVILAPNRDYDIWILQEQTLLEGYIHIHTPPSGQTVSLPPIYLRDPISWDTDNDGLHDAGELVMGTDAQKADTDGDGINDADEVRNGTDPTDGAQLPTGVLASVKTLGNAVDVCTFNQLAAVAEGTSGVSIWSIANPLAPVRLAQFDTPGSVLAVAAGADVFVAADGSAGLAVIDVAQPQSPALRFQVALGASARAVGIAGRIAYVGLDNGRLCLVDVVAGRIIDLVTIGSAAVEDVLVAGDMVYVLTDGKVTGVSLLEDGGAVVGTASSPGSLAASFSRHRLTAGGGMLFSTSIGGINVFDISQNSGPKSVASHNMPQRGWKQIVPNGTGYGVGAVGAASSSDGAHDISLYTLAGPQATPEFASTLPTPGQAHALSLDNGLAFVADGPAGLQVVNYLPFDTHRLPPTISLTASFPLNPARVEEGSYVRLGAIVGDDVQIRNVEFYVDGTRVATDGNFPFEIRFLTPVRSATKSSVTLQARATDTGGNSTWSDAVTAELVLDAHQPRVVRVLPFGGGRVVNEVTAFFSEPLSPASVTGSSFQLFAAGPDSLTGTPDDIPIGAAPSTSSVDSSATLTLASALPDGLYRARITTQVTDLAGNPLAQEYAWEFRVAPATFWTGLADNRWSNPVNWSPSVLPGPADLVILGGDPLQTVLIEGSTVEVGGILAFQPLEIRNATLKVASTLESRSPVTLNGGRLLGVAARIQSPASLRVLSNGANLLDRLNLIGDLDLTTPGAYSHLQGGLTVAGTVRLANSGYFDVDQSQSLEVANLQFESFSTINIPANVVLTFAPTTLVHGQRGQIQGSGKLINQGRIDADVAGGQISIGTANFENSGAIEAHNGGSVAIQAKWSGAGALNAVKGRITLGGSFGLPLPPISQGPEGVIALGGLFDLNGGEATFNAATGSPWLDGATIRNGTLHFLDGTRLRVTGSGGNVLDKATIDGDLDFTTSGAYSHVRGGLAVSGVLRMANSGYLQVDETQTLNVAMLEFGNFASIEIPASAVLTFPPTTLVHGQRGQIQGGGKLVNQGRIDADVAGGQIGLFSATFENTGAIETHNGGTVVLQGNWSGTGAVNAVKGRITLGGSFGLPLPPLSQGAEGVIAFSGLFDLKGGEATFNAATGSPWLDAGTIRNGTLHFLDGTRLRITGSGGNVLEKAIIDGDLDFTSSGAYSHVRGGLGVSGVLRMANSGYLQIDESQTLNVATIEFGNFSSIEIPVNTTLTFPQGTFVHGQRAQIQGAGKLINQGRIDADVAGGQISLYVATFENTGSVEAHNGGTVGLFGKWSGAGALNAAKGRITLGGSFGLPLPPITQGPEGVIAVGGLFDLNGGEATFNAATGSPWLDAGTIRNGTLHFLDGTRLRITGSGANVLDKATIDGDLDLTTSGAYSHVRGSLGVSGVLRMANSGYLQIDDNLTFNVAALEFGNYASIEIAAQATLTLGPTTLVHGQTGNIRGNGTLVNQGKVSADVNGGVITLNPTTVINQGVFEQKNGGKLVAPGFVP